MDRHHFHPLATLDDWTSPTTQWIFCCKKWVKCYLSDIARWLIANSDAYGTWAFIYSISIWVKLIYQNNKFTQFTMVSPPLIKWARTEISKKNHRWLNCDAASSQEPVVQVNLLDHISKRGPRGKPGQEAFEDGEDLSWYNRNKQNIRTYTHLPRCADRNLGVAP